MHTFNRVYDKVFVINMEKDVKRMSQIGTLFKKDNISFERTEAVNGKTLSQDDKNAFVSKVCHSICTDSMIGCALSHYNIWKRVVKEGLKSVLVFEDDVYFMDNYEEIFNKAITELPEDWDIFYLGCIGMCDKNKDYKNPFMYTMELFKNKETNKLKSENIFIPEFPLATHAYAISLEGCKKLLKKIEKVSYHIDFLMARQHKHMNVFACHPNIAYQLSDDSSISASGFPNLINRWLSKYKDEKNFKYDYFMTVPLIKYINNWTIVFFILGILSAQYKYVLYGTLLLLLIECDVSNTYYCMSIYVFLIPFFYLSQRKYIYNN